jgi:hypothetical protein
MMEIVPHAAWSKRGQWAPTSDFVGPAKGLVVHHSVTRVSGDAAADARVVDDVIWGRRTTSKFAMIAYSYLLHPDGTIFEGRGVRKRNGANNNTKGGDLSNRNTLSVCLIGDYRTDQVTAAQRSSLAALTAWLRAEGHLTADADLAGHRELHATACPGPNVVAVLADRGFEMSTTSVATRGEFIAALGVALNWAGDPIVVAVKHKITSQTVATFGADRPINRGEAAAFLVRATGREIASLDDALVQAAQLGIFSSVGKVSDPFQRVWLDRVIGQTVAVIIAERKPAEPAEPAPAPSGLDILRAELADLRDDVETLEAAVVANGEAIEAIQDQISNLREAIADVRTEIKTSSTKLTRLRELLRKA